MKRKRHSLQQAVTRLTLIVVAAAIIALAQQAVLEPWLFSEDVQAHNSDPAPK
jgi:hypothetical protein